MGPVQAQALPAGDVSSASPDPLRAGTPLADALGAVIVSGNGLTRLSDELAAVSADVGRGVQAILAVFEEIDAIVHRLRQAGTLPGDAADQLSDQILSAFQACDFHDLTGQRVSTVRRAIKDLEGRITRMRDLARLAPADGGQAEGDRTTQLENGPRLPSDEGHLTQSDVDRLLA